MISDRNIMCRIMNVEVLLFCFVFYCKMQTHPQTAFTYKHTHVTCHEVLIRVQGTFGEVLNYHHHGILYGFEIGELSCLEWSDLSESVSSSTRMREKGASIHGCHRCACYGRFYGKPTSLNAPPFGPPICSHILQCGVVLLKKVVFRYMSH